MRAEDFERQRADDERASSLHWHNYKQSSVENAVPYPAVIHWQDKTYAFWPLHNTAFMFGPLVPFPEELKDAPRKQVMDYVLTVFLLTTKS